MNRKVTAMQISFHDDPSCRFMYIMVHRDRPGIKDTIGCQSYNNPTPSTVVRVIKTFAKQYIKISQVESQS